MSGQDDGYATLRCTQSANRSVSLDKQKHAEALLKRRVRPFVVSTHTFPR